MVLLFDPHASALFSVIILRNQLVAFEDCSFKCLRCDVHSFYGKSRDTPFEIESRQLDLHVMCVFSTVQTFLGHVF